MHFFHLIQQSAPHIYHSALPLSPKSSAFSSMILEKKTPVTEFWGRPDTWGAVMRTIKASSGRFTCMTTFGHRIAAACDDGTMGIYDSVTGALRLSLSPGGPVRVVKGSPDGYVLFCAQQEPFITMWDIQTGGLIHTFDLGVLVECIAICSKGRYLACGLSDGPVKILDVANKTDVATSGRGPPVTHLCWSELGEQLVVVRGTSAHVLDVFARTILQDFTIRGRVCGVIYARKLNKFAIASTSETKSTITVIDPGTDIPFTVTVSQQISCLSFSQITTEFVCGAETPGLEVFSIPARSWRPFGHPATITSVSVLSSGTVVANVTGSGIQLLSLDEGHTPPQQLTISPLTVHTFDEGKIIAILPTTRDHIRLYRLAAMLPLLIIPARTWPIPTDRPPILCASLEHRIAVCCFEDHHKTRLELWGFGVAKDPADFAPVVAPIWAGKAPGPRLVGGISPGGSRLVVIGDNGPSSIVQLYRTKDGTCIGDLVVGRPWPGHPRLEVEFKSRDLFYFDHDDYRVPFTISQSESSKRPYSISRQEKLPSVKQPRRYYDIDDTREWVIGSSKRICWIPPGYIGSDNRGYWWAGDALIMSGQDGVLRMITFQKPS